MIRVVRPGDGDWPSRLRDLGADAPGELYVAGPIGLAERRLLGVVGSRHVDDAGRRVAADAARTAVARGWGVVSGGAPGVDRTAMDAALAAGGVVVAFLADPLRPAAEEPAYAAAIEEGHLCLASPYGEDVEHATERAHGRNSLISAVARFTFVVATEAGGSSTWHAATDALARGRDVAAWTGAGAWPGNATLVTQGAQPVDHVGRLFG
jgi:predicted Rossmann fold nucleotide-binding protein DprA/Smf involved in DNA uptake